MGGSGEAAGRGGGEAGGKQGEERRGFEVILVKETRIFIDEIKGKDVIL